MYNIFFTSCNTSALKFENNSITLKGIFKYRYFFNY